MIKDLILQNRSYRRFHQEEKIDLTTLRELVDLARLSASTANRQPLKYMLSADPATNARIFRHLSWAGSLPEWPGPEEGERPSAYIIILGDTEISRNFNCDHGIVAQSILLGATEKGLGGCMLGGMRKDDLRQVLQIPERYEILLLVALGKPNETVIIETAEAGASTKYWRDEQSHHHVPKRSLDEIILNLD